MFNDFLSARGIDEPYTDADYFAYVDGKPRYEGVASFLASRGIELPVGQASDIPETDSVCGLGNRKNEYFNHVLARDGIAPYPGSLRLLDYLAAIELPMAVVSSSRNAEAVLDAAGLVDYFTVVMDGNLGHQLGLPGKPAPDVFVRAAQLLDVPVAESVVEDAAAYATMSRRRASGRRSATPVSSGMSRAMMRSAYPWMLARRPRPAGTARRPGKPEARISSV